VGTKRAARINVCGLVRQSYAETLAQWSAWLKLACIPFLVLAAAGTALMLIHMHFNTRLWASLVFQGASYLLLVPVATSWHRLILRGGAARVGYRFGHEEYLYLEMLMAIGITFYLVMLVSGLLFAAPFISEASWLSGSSGAEWSYRIVGWLVLFFAICRFLLVLPAAAIGREMRISQSSRALRGNAIRLSAAYFFTLLVPQSLLWFLGDPSSWVLRGSLGEVGLAWVLGSFYVGLAVTVLFWMLSVGVVSFTYKALVLQNAPENAY
ncbi:MAG: hypothetical protein WAL83_03660, partial [Arenicellales bacterium]